MRKQHAPVERDLTIGPAAPGSAREVAEAVDRDADGFSVRRGKEGGCQMRDVVLDVLDRPGKSLTGKSLRQLFRDTFPLRTIAQPVDDQLDAGPASGDICKLAAEVGSVTAVDSNVGYVRELEAALPEAIRDGHARKAGPMLDATKALLFGGRDQTPVLDETRRSIGVECIDPENIHLLGFEPIVRPRGGLTLHRTRFQLGILANNPNPTSEYAKQCTANPDDAGARDRPRIPVG